MILDALGNTQRYAGVHPGFAAAFSWFASAPIATLAPGMHQLDGERLTVTLDSGHTAASTHKRLESHRRYIDIHVGLLGPEAMEWAPVAGLQIADDFHPGGDIRFYHQPDYALTRLLVPVGHFAIFYPADAHKPVCSPGPDSIPYRKLVFKIACGAHS